MLSPLRQPCHLKNSAALTTVRALETARRQANIIAGGEGKSSVNLVQHRRKQRKIRRASHTQHVGGQGISHVTRYVLRGLRRVPSAEVGRGTGQYVAGMRLMKSRARPVEELVGVIVIKKAVLHANHC